MTSPNQATGPAMAAEWLDGAGALLDPGGLILEATGPMRTWLALPAPVPPGTRFWPLLAERFPAWREKVKSLCESNETFATLRLELPGNDLQPARWYQLERVLYAQAMVVRLESVLPPRSELEESAWDAYLGHEAARRQMFIRLVRAEARLEKLTAYWPGVIFSQRPDGSFEFVSPKIEALTGVPLPQWERQGHWFWQVVHEADLGELQQQMQQCARSGRAVTNTFRVRHLQNGRVSYVLEHRQPVISQGGLLLGYEGVWLDTTRETIAEKRLSSAAWKETLAVLTMGLAHDFGNIMAGIHSLSESFLEQLAPDHSFFEGLTLIKRNSMQASQLVTRIIHLHVDRTGDRNYHDLNAVVTELDELVRKIIPRRIQVQLELAPGSLPLYVDVVEFRQTIINLALNAADAMPEKGRLELRTSRHTEWPAPSHVQGVIPRLPGIALTVKDTGCGIKPRHLDSIFDAFFTTKSANKGSGLGLYNARLFAEKHRGAISVESTEGQGSSFVLWLPEADFTEAERAVSSPSSVPARRLSLLLLSAPGRFADATAELLRTNNYHVVAVASPEALFQALRAGDCIYSGAVVLMESDDAAISSLLNTLRRQHPMLRLMLKPLGRDHDDLPAGLVKQADLVVPSVAPDHEFLERLRGVLQAEV